MPKERRDRSLSATSSRVSPYPCSSGNDKHCSPNSAEEIKEWEEARCPVCMEHPHNAVLLLCSSHDKGCRPFMCDTSYRHSNCLDQFQKAFAQSPPIPRTHSFCCSVSLLYSPSPFNHPTCSHTLSHSESRVSTTSPPRVSRSLLQTLTTSCPPMAAEIKLWNDKREREMYDNFADLYAIIKATEKLEKAYVRDIISSSDYEPECLKLIAQFKTLTSTLKGTIPSVERFAETYKMDCPAALNRLVTSGVPATIEHRSAASAAGSTSAAVVAECVQHFITAMDTLKLNMIAVDQVHPVLADLYASLNKLSILPAEFEGRVKMKEWIGRLAKMGAADELTDQQARQLHFDLESSYNLFMAALPNAGA